MSLGRRKWLTILGTTGATAIAGCFVLSENLRNQEIGRRIPDEIETLHIRSGEVHELAAGAIDSYGMIRWETGGTLTIEPDGGVGLVDISYA